MSAMVCEKCHRYIENGRHFAVIYTRRSDGVNGDHRLCLDCYDSFYTWLRGHPMGAGGGGD